MRTRVHDGKADLGKADLGKADLGKADLYTLSDLLHWQVIDAQGIRYSITDLATDATQTYPSITYIVIRIGRKTALLPWSAVHSYDTTTCRFHINDGQHVTGVYERINDLRDTGHPGDLLKHDLLDAWILVVPQRVAARANRLLLRFEDNHLRLCAVDIGIQALASRITQSLRLKLEFRGNLVDWAAIVFLRGTLRALSSAKANEDQTQRAHKLSAMLPAEIARLSDVLPFIHTAELIALLPVAQAADMLEALALDRQIQVFAELQPEHAQRVLAHMAPDTAARLISQLPIEEAEALLARLPQIRRQRVVDLLRYPDGTAASLMTNDLLVVPAHGTVGEAIDWLRPNMSEPDFTAFVYVVDDLSTYRLSGAISLRGLMATSADQPLADLVGPNLITLAPLEPDTLAAYRVIESQLAAVPVVANDGRLLGAVPIDSAIARVVPPQIRAQLPRIFS